MKTHAAHSIAGLLMAGAAAVQAGEARLPDGRLYETGVLTVTFKDDFAGRISRDPADKPREVLSRDIAALHPSIKRVEARHLSARRWLRGEAMPTKVKKSGKVPRIARNVEVVLAEGEDTAAAAAALRQRPEVETVSLNFLYPMDAVPNDQHYAQQWGMNKIGIPDGDWDVPGRGRIRVAVVDSGVDREHPDLAARIVFGAGYGANAPANGDAPADRRDGFDHGTHVAGIIAAIRNNIPGSGGIVEGVAGVSNNIDLMAMGCAEWSESTKKYVNSRGAAAINDAVANGARVINCSFGPARSGGRADLDEAMNEALDNAWDHNVLVVVSAGNAQSNTTDHYWAQSGVPFIISASEQNSPATDPEMFYSALSNFGPRINLCAPGRSIYSTVPTGGAAGSIPYDLMSGTSMAAPHVTGAAAHIMSMNPALIEDHSARHLLIRMAVDGGTAGKDDYYGWGRLRIRRDVLQALRDADIFVCNTDNTGPDLGTYDGPLPSISAAVNAVRENGVIVLNGGDIDDTRFTYPAITITKKCVLTALPDRPVTIGVP